MLSSSEACPAFGGIFYASELYTVSGSQSTAAIYTTTDNNTQSKASLSSTQARVSPPEADFRAVIDPTSS
ncbi:MAG: hypothetical protein QME52_06060 [Bacteroidota bacterium]|nr:hypothetical protein [Bacteroidota bacterium]